MNEQLPSPSHVIGIGASAGGLEALERFFRAMPVDSGLTFVVIQHLSPDFKSLMNELLERFTSMAAIPVVDTAEIRPNTIYLLPPRKDLIIDGNRLISRDREKDGSLSLPINTFFRSLAASWGDRAVAIVLSGTGSDGSNGLLDIRDAGGFVLVQTPDSARFDGMPQSAINTGCVDVILDPEQMPAALAAFVMDPSSRHFVAADAEENTEAYGIPTILQLLKKHYFIDFSNYKPATIIRRIERRVSLSLNGENIEDYSKRLINDADELNQLYKDLLIGVTRFFRDAEAFSIIKEKVVPRILKTLDLDEEVRIWVCGCSTGEEAYSIAILFHEGFKELKMTPRLKILATDLHQTSIQTAGEGIYSEDRFADMPAELKENYFEQIGEGLFKVRPQLRKSLIFSLHNVLKDPPFTKLHLVSCRNLLIYFQPTAQARTIAMFHYALKLNGVLFMGASETPGDLINEMEPVDRQWKIFAKTNESSFTVNLRNPGMAKDVSLLRMSKPAATALPRLYESLMEKFMPDGIVVNEQREILHIFGMAAQFVHGAPGRFTSDILELVPHSLSLALTTAFRSAAKNFKPIHLKGVCCPDSNDHQIRLMISVEPFKEKSSNALFYMIRIQPDDVPQPQAMDVSPALPFDPDSESAQQLRELELELQKARESLQSTVEELETTNEELQASNEELLASNEELQSTNEELHSVNEELYSVNAEHELKIDELNQLSSNLRNLIQSTDTATIFVDKEFRIRLFTPRTSEIFNLLQQDLGRDLRHFKTKWPDPYLFEDISGVLGTGTFVERHLEWGENNSSLRRCMVYLDVTGKQAGAVINYTDTSSITQITRALQESENQFKLILQTVPTAILVVSRGGNIVMANFAASNLFGYLPDEFQKLTFVDLLPQDSQQSSQVLLASLFFLDTENQAVHKQSLNASRKDASEVDIELIITPIVLNHEKYILTAITDITEQKKLEDTKQQALQEAIHLAETRSRFLANMSHEIRTPLNAVLGFAELIFMEPDDIGKTKSNSRKILESGHHLMSIINDILDFSKLDAGKMEIELLPVSLRDFLYECMELIKPSINGKPIELEVDIQEGLPSLVLIDPLRVRQIIMNLLSNAIKFSDAGKIQLKANLDQGFLLLDIEDHGVGIPLEKLSSLFKPFEQADLSLTRKYGGTGLGLAICKKLAEAMGGNITVTSKKGSGSNFRVSIPYKIVHQTVINKPVEVMTHAETDLKGLQILLAEDVDFNQALFVQILSSVGVLVTIANNGLEAVDQIKNAEKYHFDLVLMDIQMPEMDGYQAAQIIHTIDPDLPIIALTANAFDEDRNNCIAAGMVEFISKPVPRNTLIKLVAQYARRRH